MRLLYGLWYPNRLQSKCYRNLRWEQIWLKTELRYLRFLRSKTEALRKKFLQWFHDTFSWKKCIEHSYSLRVSTQQQSQPNNETNIKYRFKAAYNLKASEQRWSTCVHCRELLLQSKEMSADSLKQWRVRLFFNAWELPFSFNFSFFR